ncbi:hypothetical protein BH11MYX3_BH11MYX3_27600 [soil metagenome]
MRTSVAIALLVAACVDKGSGPQPKKIEPGFVGAHLLTQPPALTAKLDVDFGGKVIYLGNTVESPRIVPGGAVKITHYWKVVAPPGPGWKTFTLFRGAAGMPDFMALPETDMSVAHGPATWRAGEIIEDPQEITLRPDWRSPTATLSVGLVASGAHGIDDRMAAQGPNVIDRAVTARVFDVDLSRAPPPPGTIYVPYARGPITIDGLPADIGWTGAVTSPELVTGEGSPEPVGKATAKMTWDDTFLYLFVTITDSDVFSEFKKHDDPLWKQDCVEMFIDADGNKRGYVELQVNPNNATFDSWFAQGRAAKGDEAWDSAMATAVVMRGTADKGGDTDQGWDVEIAIPWMSIKGRDQGMSVIIPPRVGDRWRLNVVRVDKKTGDKDPAVSSWNRITYADFHALDRMLTVVFADPNGGIAPGTPFGSAAAGSGSGSAVDPGSGSAAQAGSAAPPVAEVAIQATSRNTATISINGKGEHTINGAVVKDADLTTVLRSLYARDNNLELLVVLEPGVAREKSSRVLEVAKAVGITKVAVQPTPPPTR